MRKYLLALDLALGTTGFVIINTDKNGDASIVESGSIKTAGYKERSAKLNFIGTRLLAILEKYPIKEVALEQAFSRHIKSTAAIYSVVGLIQYLLHGYPQHFYAPSSVKKVCTGSGNASKEDVRLAMEEYFDYFDFENEDESDAAGVAYCHLKKTGVL